MKHNRQTAGIPLPPERREHPSTYFLEDRSKKEDLTRLQIQDQMLTSAMGGIFPEQPDPMHFRHVLDVGCGTGGWLLAAAQTYPHLCRLEGVDISGKMMEYARRQAAAQQVEDRVQFHVMDALRMLEFPTGSFDLVNQRSGQSYLRTWDWRKLLQEYRRVVRPGGVIRISEGEWGGETNSPALAQLFDLLLLAFYQAGHSFSLKREGVTEALEHLLRQHGCVHVQSRTIHLEYRAGTPQGDLFREDMALTFKLITPFLRKWASVPDEYEQLYNQALEQMLAPDFVARGTMMTVWGDAAPPQELFPII